MASHEEVKKALRCAAGQTVEELSIGLPLYQVYSLINLQLGFCWHLRLFIIPMQLVALFIHVGTGQRCHTQQYGLQSLGGDHTEYLDDSGPFQHLNKLTYEHKCYL